MNPDINRRSFFRKCASGLTGLVGVPLISPSSLGSILRDLGDVDRAFYADMEGAFWASYENGGWQRNLKHAPFVDNEGSKDLADKSYWYDGTGAVVLGRYNIGKSAAHASKVLPQTKRLVWALSQYLDSQGLSLWAETNAGPNHTKKGTDHVKGLGVDVFITDLLGNKVRFNPDDSESMAVYNNIVNWVNQNAKDLGVKMTIGYEGCKATKYNNRHHNDHLHVSMNG